MDMIRQSPTRACEGIPNPFGRLDAVRDTTDTVQVGTLHAGTRKVSSAGRTARAVIAILFLIAATALPLVNVFAQALTQGWSYYCKSLFEPDTMAAIRLTLIVAAISVPLNVFFGLAAAWAIAKFQFRGRTFLITLIDLPFSVSPVVAGLMLVVLFGLQGFFGKWLDAHEFKIIFAVPGIVMATVFITFPFVARELIPVMQATGTEQEQAALTLGAKGALIVSGDRTIPVAAEPVGQVIDTTGAGDLYAAGFLYGFTKGKPLDVCGRIAAIAAAEVISHVGARPQHNLAELLREKKVL